MQRIVLVNLGACNRRVLMALIELVRDWCVLVQVTDTPLLGHPGVCFVRICQVRERLVLHLNSADS